MKNEYLKEGDLVRVSVLEDESNVGIVVEIGEHGQVSVFWPHTNKTTKSGKEWAELHFELIVDENTN